MNCIPYLNEYSRIFKKYTDDENMPNSCKFIGIGMGNTMLDFSNVLPNDKIYLSASNQTRLFLSSKTQQPLENSDSIDVYFDSADAYDLTGNLIKGGGGSLTLEKLMLKMARRSVIIVQQDKLVDSFVNCSVPVEILKECLGVFMKILKTRKINGKLRLVNELSPFITDNGNYIVDVVYNHEFIEECKNITGVIEHGYFPRTLGYTLEII